MAGNDDRKAELRAELEHARSRASAFRQQIQSRPSLSSKAQNTFKRNRVAWLIGAVLLGLLVSKLPGRTKKVPVNRWTRKKVEVPLEQAGKAGYPHGASEAPAQRDETDPHGLGHETHRPGGPYAERREAEGGKSPLEDMMQGWPWGEAEATPPRV